MIVRTAGKKGRTESRGVAGEEGRAEATGDGGGNGSGEKGDGGDFSEEEQEKEDDTVMGEGHQNVKRRRLLVLLH